MSECCDVCRAAGSMRPYCTVSLCGVYDAQVWRCDACGFRQIRPRLTPGELRRLYPEDYFDLDSPIGFSDYARERLRGERDAYFLARELGRFRPQGDLLDVGCALGFLIDALRRRCRWSVRGIDVSAFAAYFATRKLGLDVRAVTLEEAAFPAGSFDYVVQKDLLEHVLRPREHLEETARILRPGGRVWLVTPNGEANLRPLERAGRALARQGEGRLPMLDQAHLQFFTRENLVRLFTECGFRLVRMRSISVRRGLRALGVLPPKRRKLKTAAAGFPRPADAGAAGPAAPGATDAPAAAGGGAAAEPDARTVALYERMSQAVDRQRSALRSSALYFEFRSFMNALDTVPARWALGNDFSCLLEKR